MAQSNKPAQMHVYTKSQLEKIYKSYDECSSELEEGTKAQHAYFKNRAKTKKA